MDMVNAPTITLPFTDETGAMLSIVTVPSSVHGGGSDDLLSMSPPLPAQWRTALSAHATPRQRLLEVSLMLRLHPRRQGLGTEVPATEEEKMTKWECLWQSWVDFVNQLFQKR